MPPRGARCNRRAAEDKPGGVARRASDRSQLDGAAAPARRCPPPHSRRKRRRRACPAPAAAADAPDEQVIDFSADSVTYDSDADVVTASGRVRMTRDGNYLAADQVNWDRKTGEVRADGNVVVVTPAGRQADRRPTSS